MVSSLSFITQIQLSSDSIDDDQHINKTGSKNDMINKLIHSTDCIHRALELTNRTNKKKLTRSLGERLIEFMSDMTK